MSLEQLLASAPFTPFAGCWYRPLDSPGALAPVRPAAGTGGTPTQCAPRPAGAGAVVRCMQRGALVATPAPVCRLARSDEYGEQAGTSDLSPWPCRHAAITACRSRHPRNFCSVLAVTPQVGWLLGLGDRHLDNMLLHRRQGHVVHIDFNVIFDRCGPVRAASRQYPATSTTCTLGGLRPGGHACQCC